MQEALSGPRSDLLGDLLASMDDSVMERKMDDDAAEIVDQTIRLEKSNFYKELASNVFHSIVKEDRRKLELDAQNAEMMNEESKRIRQRVLESNNEIGRQFQIMHDDAEEFLQEMMASSETTAATDATDATAATEEAPVRVESSRLSTRTSSLSTKLFRKSVL